MRRLLGQGSPLWPFVIGSGGTILALRVGQMVESPSGIVGALLFLYYVALWTLLLAGGAGAVGVLCGFWTARFGSKTRSGVVAGLLGGWITTSLMLLQPGDADAKLSLGRLAAAGGLAALGFIPYLLGVAVASLLPGSRPAASDDT